MTPWVPTLGSTSRLRKISLRRSRRRLMMVLGLTELVRLLCRFVFTLKPREIELVFFLSFLGNQSSPPPAPLVTNKLWTTSDLEVSFFSVHSSTSFQMGPKYSQVPHAHLTLPSTPHPLLTNTQVLSSPSASPPMLPSNLTFSPTSCTRRSTSVLTSVTGKFDFLFSQTISRPRIRSLSPSSYISICGCTDGRS